MQVFIASKVEYAGQAVGLIVAKKQNVARKAAKMVKITYKNLQKPILTIKEAVPDEHLPQADNEGRTTTTHWLVNMFGYWLLNIAHLYIFLVNLVCLVWFLTRPIASVVHIHGWSGRVFLRTDAPPGTNSFA